MGGLFSKKKNKEKPQPPAKPAPPKVQISEQELVLADVKLHCDKLDRKIASLDKQAANIDGKIKDRLREKKKEEAYFLIKQLKEVKNLRKSACVRRDIVAKQEKQIQESLNDVKFTEVLKESNKAIQELNAKIDYEEVRIAKELQQEGKMRREELDDLLDEEEDKDIFDELNKMEADMVAEQFGNAEDQKKEEPQAITKPQKAEKVENTEEPQLLAN